MTRIIQNETLQQVYDHIVILDEQVEFYWETINSAFNSIHHILSRFTRQDMHEDVYHDLSVIVTQLQEAKQTNNLEHCIEMIRQMREDKEYGQ